MFHTLFYEPIYNLIAFVLTITPLHDIGIAIIIVTLIVKGILLPLNLSAIRSQYILKKLEKEMKEIKETYKKNPQEASKKTMEMYRREKINPFASILVVIIQIPIFFALYSVFNTGLKSDPNSLYSFISFPEQLHTIAFGLFDVTQKNIVMAVLAGISSYFLAKRQTEGMIPVKDTKEEETFQDQFMKSMRIQLLYVLPVVIAFFGSVLPAVLALYWFVGNIVGYAQDVYIKNKLKHLHTI